MTKRIQNLTPTAKEPDTIFGKRPQLEARCSDKSKRTFTEALLRLLHFAALSTLLLLGGCFDIKQSYVFGSNGQLEFSSTTAIKLHSDYPSAANDIRAWCSSATMNGQGLVGEVALSSKRGQMTCSVTASGNAKELVTAIDASSMVSGEGPQKRSVKLERLREQFLLTVTIPGFGTAARSSDEQEQKIIDAIMAEAPGRALTWTVKAPRIIASNGKINSAKNTATFSRPLAEVLQSSQSKTFTVRFKIVE